MTCGSPSETDSGASDLHDEPVMANLADAFRSIGLVSLLAARAARKTKAAISPGLVAVDA